MLSLYGACHNTDDVIALSVLFGLEVLERGRLQASVLRQHQVEDASIFAPTFGPVFDRGGRMRLVCPS